MHMHTMHPVGISHYEDEEHLLEAAVEIQALVYKDVMT